MLQRTAVFPADLSSTSTMPSSPGAADPTFGNLSELDAIAAAAIDDASLVGGKSSIIGALLGAVIPGSLRNGLTLLNVQAFYQLLTTGIIILVAMLIDRATRGRE